MSYRESPESLFEKWINYSDSTQRVENKKVVYHYTNSHALINIIKSGGIFCTDYRFLNDRTERTYALNQVKLICESFKSPQASKNLLRFLYELQMFLDKPAEVRTFVASFSERRDDLSQWRGYANEGEGFTIGFDTGALARLGNNGRLNTTFGKVSYKITELNEKMKSLIHEFSQSIDENSSPTQISEAAAWCEASISSICAFFKHNSFQSEREWRIVCDVARGDSINIDVRSRGNLIVPYIELDLRNAGAALPVVEIGIGPGFANPNVNQSVLDLCGVSKLKPEIYLAATPYIRN